MFEPQTIELPTEQLAELQECYENVQAFTLNTSALKAYINEQISDNQGWIEFILSGEDFPTWEFEIERSKLFARDIFVTLQTEKGERSFIYNNTTFYEGVVNESGRVSQITITDDIFKGVIYDGDRVYVIEPITTQNNFPILVAYTKNVCENFPPALTNTTDERVPCSGSGYIANQCNNVRADISFISPQPVVELAVDVDYDFYQAYHSGIVNNNGIDSGVRDEIGSLLVEVNNIYGDYFSLFYKIVNINVWAVDDPYNHSSIENLMKSCKDYWGDSRSCIQRDLVHLFSAKPSGFGANGVVLPEDVGGLGNIERGYSLTNHPDVNSDGEVDIESGYKTIIHEFGHTMGLGELEGDMNCNSSCDGSDDPVMCQRGVDPEGFGTDYFILKNQCLIDDFIRTTPTLYDHDDSPEESQRCLSSERCAITVDIRADNSSPNLICNFDDPSLKVINFEVEVCNGCRDENMDIEVTYNRNGIDITDTGSFTDQPNTSNGKLTLPTETFAVDECRTYSFTGQLKDDAPDRFVLTSNVFSSEPKAEVDDVAITKIEVETTIDGTTTPARTSQLALIPNCQEDAPRRSMLIKGTLIVDQNQNLCSYDIFMDTDAVIEIEDGVTFDIGNNVISSCDKLWKGIYLKGSDAEIIMDNCTIENARKAISTDQGGKFEIGNNVFRNNIIGIRLKKHHAQTGDISFRGFTNNLFTSDSNYSNIVPPNNLIISNVAPHAGVLLDVAFETETAQIISLSALGGPSNKNIYENLHTGIHLFCPGNTTVRVINSQFINIQSNDQPKFLGAGIYMQGFDSNNSKLDQSGFGHINGNPSFSNCNYGIYALETHADIENNIMENVNVGVVVKKSDNRTILIKKNRIEALFRGIELSENLPLISGKITEAHIFVGYPRDGSTPTSDESAGIFVNESPFATTGWNIDNSDIKLHSAKYGIYSSTGSQSTIIDNNISFDPQGNSGYHDYQGITFINGNNNTADCNDISGRSSHSDSFGVYVEGETSSFINCNILDDTNVGLNYVGANNGTFIQGNGFNSHNTGLQVGKKNKFNRVDGDVVIPEHRNRTNQWFELNSMNSTGSRVGAEHLGDGQQISQSLFFVNESDNAFYLPSINTPFTNENWFVTSAPGNRYQCTDCTVGSQTQVRQLNQSDLDIANGNLVASTCEEAFLWTAKLQTYTRLLGDIPVIEYSSKPIILNFLATNATTNIGLFYEVDRAIREMVNLDATTHETFLQNYLTITTNEAEIVEIEQLLATNPPNVEDLHQRKSELIEASNQLQIMNSQFIMNHHIHKMTTAEVIANQIAAIPVVESWEYNEQEVRAIYLRSLIAGVEGLSDADQVRIRQIAVKCPKCDGYGVFLARTLLATFDDIIVYDELECDYIEPLRELPESSITNFSVSIYPNPTQNVLNIRLPDTLVKGKIEIYNSLGTLIAERVSEGNEITTFSTTLLPTGIYYVNITDGQTVIVQEKVVLIK